MAGNRCWHDRLNPMLTVQVKHKPLSIISKITKKLDDFFYNPDLLSGLNSTRAKPLINQARQMRTERREAVVRVMSGLLHYTDLTTMRVGFYTADGFKPLGVRFFVKLTGLSQSRYERALADINAAGLITTHTRCRQDSTGKYIGLNAVRCVSAQLFEVFGLGNWLHKQRKKCSTKLRELAEKISISKTANFKMLLRASNNKKSSYKVTNTRDQQQPQPPPGKEPNHPNLKSIWNILHS